MFHLKKGESKGLSRKKIPLILKSCFFLLFKTDSFSSCEPLTAHQDLSIFAGAFFLLASEKNTEMLISKLFFSVKEAVLIIISLVRVYKTVNCKKCGVFPRIHFDERAATLSDRSLLNQLHIFLFSPST